MNYQYYPTGAHTAAKMWAKFKRKVTHVCDPSAGKGNLIAHAKDGFKDLTEDQIPWLKDVNDEVITQGRFSIRLRENARKKFADIREIGGIEIDFQHHPNLKELGVKVIGYDFMEVTSLATVDSVIMNPPFQDGVSHVLHAWDCVYDAELVAIINAESLRNPYSADRKHLAELINKYGSVEFLQDEFITDVERSTTVEIALLYLAKVPPRYLDMDSLFSGLHKEMCIRDSLFPE